MARAYSGCEVLHQDFLAMELPKSRFDGVFANASLFHVPSQELPRVLLELSETLKPGGVLFCSNPRGNNEEGFRGDRYSCFFDLDTWRNYVSAAGFIELRHYYRPPGLPLDQQPWLATVWRKGRSSRVGRIRLTLRKLNPGKSLSALASAGARNSGAPIKPESMS